MNLKTKVKSNIMTEVYSNTHIYDFFNGLVANTSASVMMNRLVEFSQTERKVKFVGFNNDLSKKTIPIGASKDNMDLLYGTVNSHMNESILLQG